MSEMTLTQAEANALIMMEKHRLTEEQLEFPGRGKSLIVPLQSPDKREQFLLDISLGRIDLLRGKFQDRARQVIVLARLDFGGQPHRNPDDEEIPCPHLHVYREGYGDKWALRIPSDRFPGIGDVWGTLEDFMRFCNITRPPNILRGLFT